MQLFITTLYAVTGVIAVLAYFPQMAESWRSGGAGVSIPAWLMWTISAVTSTAYACYVLLDMLLTALSFLNFVCCLVILLTGLKRQII